MHLALSMPLEERTQRMRRMREVVAEKRRLPLQPVESSPAFLRNDPDDIPRSAPSRDRPPSRFPPEKTMHSPVPLLERLTTWRPPRSHRVTCSFFLILTEHPAPLTATPPQTRPPAGTRAVLERLAQRVDCTVGIVSGLPRRRARGSGSTGSSVPATTASRSKGGGLRFDETVRGPALKHEIEVTVEALSKRLGHIPGILVEPKGLTASTHYRLVQAAHWDEVEQTMRSIIAQDHPDLVVTAGKMVWEVRPRVPWHKGAAVRWIREQLGLQQAMTFYLGDDRTDEDAFLAVGRHVTARVGPPQPTQAGYRVSDTEEVAEFSLALPHHPFCRSPRASLNEAGNREGAETGTGCSASIGGVASPRSIHLGADADEDAGTVGPRLIAEEELVGGCRDHRGDLGDLVLQ